MGESRFEDKYKLNANPTEDELEEKKKKKDEWKRKKAERKEKRRRKRAGDEYREKQMTELRSGIGAGDGKVVGLWESIGNWD